MHQIRAAHIAAHLAPEALVMRARKTSGGIRVEAIIVGGSGFAEFDLCRTAAAVALADFKDRVRVPGSSDHRFR